MQNTLGIIVGGGPAPGINGVIGSAGIEAINNGMKVVGFYDGFARLAGEEFDQSLHSHQLTIKEMSRIHFDGGSILRTSRTNLIDRAKLEADMPVTPDAAKIHRVYQRLRSLGITHLMTIGGDDTALSARFIADESKGAIRVVHVPKTIDNDLPLPSDVPTFGFTTARHYGAEIVANLMEDARTTCRWYICVTMGRQAGFLALEIGKAAGVTLSIIPEEFPELTTISHIADVIECSILKRRTMGRDNGVAVLAEGLAYRLGDAKELARMLGRDVPVDAAGHPRLSEVPLGDLLRDEIRRRFENRGDKLTLVSHTLGYELRCAKPTPADMSYTRDLGHGGVRLLLDPESDLTGGAMVTIQDGNLVPITFASMVDPETNRTRIRQVDMNCYTYKVARAYMIRLEAADLASPTTLAALAAEAHMSQDEFKERYGHVAGGINPSA